MGDGRRLLVPPLLARSPSCHLPPCSGRLSASRQCSTPSSAPRLHFMEDADGLCQSARLGIGDTAILVATDDRDRSSDDIAHSVYTVDNACIFHTAHFLHDRPATRNPSHRPTPAIRRSLRPPFVRWALSVQGPGAWPRSRRESSGERFSSRPPVCLGTRSVPSLTQRGAISSPRTSLTRRLAPYGNRMASILSVDQPCSRSSRSMAVS